MFVLAEVSPWVSGTITVLAVLTALLMTFLILLQEGKGGGLTALGGTKAAGVEGVSNPVRRATAYLAVIFFVLLVLLGILNRPEKSILGGTLPPASSSSLAPASEPKKDSAPPVEAAKPDAPKAEAPKAEAPKTETPTTETPKAETPKSSAPKTETPASGAPQGEAPKTEAAK